MIFRRSVPMPEMSDRSDTEWFLIYLGIFLWQIGAWKKSLTGLSKNVGQTIQGVAASKKYIHLYIFPSQMVDNISIVNFTIDLER